jgi:dienelactone hydrolase
VQVGDAPALPGMLTVPKGPGPFAALVLVHGSGPNDEDESVGGVRVFRDLAYGLASRGVAVLRYVKRTRVAPAGVVTQKEEVIDGAHAAIDLLRRTPEIDAKRIYLLGHSQGGYLAPRIAAGDPGGLAGIVILAGPTRPLEDLLVEQLTYLSSLDPANASLAADLEASRKLVQVVRDPALRSDDDVALPDAGSIKGAYFLDVRGYDPVAVAKSISCPLLVLQGERDYQVTMKDFERWRTGLASKRGATLKTYPTLNHLFVSGSGKPSPAEYNAPGHVAEGVVDDIAGWVVAPRHG